MPIALILLVAAFVLFVIDAFTVQSRFNLTAAGLACVAAFFILTHGMVG